MFASRMLLRTPGSTLSLSPHIQLRTFTLARIALKPAKNVTPAPPPPPPQTKSRTTTTKKTVVEEVKPAPKRRLVLSDKERAAVAKEKERVRVANAKARAKERAAKLREKEREKARKEKAKEKEQAVKAKKAEKPYPLPPKRPMGAYILYAGERRETGQNDSTDVTQSATQSGEAWRALSDSQKAPYLKKSEDARIKYKSDLASWISSLDHAQLAAARTNKEPGTQDDAAMEQLPKRPSNAYAIFLKEAAGRQDVIDRAEAAAKKSSGGDPIKAKKAKIGQFGKIAAELWHGMSDKEKLVYQNKAVDAKKDWDEKFGSLITQQKEAHQSATA